MTESLRGQLIDVLLSAPATRGLPDVPALVDALLPTVHELILTELTMAADAAEYCVEYPEHPWAQGVQFVVDALRDRAAALEGQTGGGGGSE